MKFVRITLKKMNRFKKISYNDNTFNRLYNDYTLRSKRKDKIKNYYLVNESDSFPYHPKLENKEYFPFSTRVIPSVYNFRKNYYNPNSNYFNKNYTERRNITDSYKNFEENKNNNNRYNNMSNKKAISSRINKDINENLFQYLTNTKLKKKSNILTSTNFSNQKNLFPYKNNKISSKNKNIITSKSKSKPKNNSENNINNDLIYWTTKSLNPSTLSGVEHLKTNYTNRPNINNNINNIKSNNAITSNINSASSRINDLKMISGIGEYFYDFNSGKKRKNINNNMNNEQRDLSMQTISDSKIMELAGKYVNEEDNSSENYHMNNIIYSKKKYISKKNK